MSIQNNQKAALARLERQNSKWYCGVRHARLWYKDKLGRPVRPYEIVVMEGGSDLVRSHKVIDCLPSAENYEPVLLEAMLQSSRKLKSA